MENEDSMGLQALAEAAIKTLMVLIKKGHVLCLTASGGKDSTTTTALGIEAIRRVKKEGASQPVHYVTSSSTGVENPAMENHLLAMHAEIRAFVEAEGLPVEVRMVQPTLAASFAVNIVGRGTLPRFPENGKKRTCSVDWKVKPQQRLATQIANQAKTSRTLEPIAVIGTRRSESAARAGRMAERQESAAEPVRNAEGHLTLSVIAEWGLEEVWDFLVSFMDAKSQPFPSFADEKNIRRMLDLYRDGNEGTCGILAGDNVQKAPCGPRFGCALCTIAGPADKSMEAMLRESKYAHLIGLNALRNYLVNTRFDLGTRELVGRTVSDVGYVAVRPDVYNLLFRKRLLRYMLTLDALEVERAEELAEAIASGEAPDTPENQAMSDPQFQLVTPSQIVAIDFFWSMHHYAEHAFPAITLWHDVHTLGRRYPVPGTEAPVAAKIPARKWFPVGAFDHDVPTDGLRSYDSELWNPHRHPDRPAYREVNGERVTWFNEEEMLSVDATEALLFVDCTFPDMFLEVQYHPAIESARFWLNEGILSLPSGMAGRYQTMAKRGQYFSHLTERLNVTPKELDAFLMEHSITESEHNELLADMGQFLLPPADAMLAMAPPGITASDKQFALF